MSRGQPLEDSPMQSLTALAAELSEIVARLEESDDDDEEPPRLGELIAAINTRAPQSLGDCLVKLKLLADPGLGIEAGDREDDMISLRQVVAFLDGVL
jgi:hypothetical protein